MRQITKEAVKAFYNLENFNKSNTKVKYKTMYLHWNLIAKLEGWVLSISNAWWASNTTKERLNGLLPDWMKIFQKKWNWYLTDWIDTIDFIKWNVLNNITIF